MTDRRPTSICLAMLIADEVDVLEECLAACRSLIDRWLICHPASADVPEELIHRELAGIPGELRALPASDSEHARETMIELARGRADYLLLLEPDWVIDAAPESLAHLTADAYLASVLDGEPGVEREILVRADLDTTDPSARERLDGVAISVHRGDDGRLARLKAEVQRDPGDAGALFRLARAHHELADRVDDDDRRRLALELYRRRGAMPGWAEETYCAWLEAGALCERLGDWPAALDAYARAWEVRPERLEAAHALAVGLRVRGLRHAAHRFASLASGLRPLPRPPDLLGVAPWIYEWGLLFEYSISAYWCDEYDAAIAACRRLLAITELPDEHRAATRRNLNLATAAKVREAPADPAIVRRAIPPGTPTWGYRGHDQLTPVELRVPGLARRLAELCGMSPQDVDRRLLGLGEPVEVAVAALAPWPLRVRPGTSDVALIDTVCNAATHLPPVALEEPRLIIDVGAQIGITTLDLARRYPSARLVAVEMDAGSVALCAHNLKPLAERATLVGAAVTARDGTASYATTGDPGHHAVVSNGEGRATAITLDTLLEHAAPGDVVDYLRMSIEGSEEDVLGASGRWPASVRSIAVVAHGSYGLAGALADLRRLGFEIVDDEATALRASGVRAAPRPYRAGLRPWRARRGRR